MINVSVHFMDEEEQIKAAEDPKTRKFMEARGIKITCAENFFVNSFAIIGISLEDGHYEFEVLLTEWLKAFTIGIRIVQSNRRFDLKLYMLIAGENFEISYQRGTVVLPICDIDGHRLELKLTPEQSIYMHGQLKNYLFEMLEICNVAKIPLADSVDYQLEDFLDSKVERLSPLRGTWR